MTSMCDSLPPLCALSILCGLGLYCITYLGPASQGDYDPQEENVCIEHFCLAQYSPFGTSRRFIGSADEETAHTTLTLQESLDVT